MSRATQNTSMQSVNLQGDTSAFKRSICWSVPALGLLSQSANFVHGFEFVHGFDITECEVPSFIPPKNLLRAVVPAVDCAESFSVVHTPAHPLDCRVR